MSRKRTKKEKIAYQKRMQERIQNAELINQLELERQNKLDEQAKLDTKLKESKKIKNVKIFKSLFKLTYPYIITMVGVQIPVYLCQGGLPFRIDTYNCYKVKTLEATYDGDVNYEEEYKTNFWWEDNVYPNEFKITTPWELCEDGTKIRFIREYEIKYSDEIADAILERNYASLENLISPCSNEIVEKTNDQNISDDTYHFEGVLGTIETDSSIKIPESEETNDIITKVELIFFLLISSLILKYRRFRFIKHLKSVNAEYSLEEKAYKIHSKEVEIKINEIDEKILSLRK